MFAFAVWDSVKRRLIIGRDRLGIKPLYLSINSERIIFASELKSILEYPGFCRELNKAAVREYLALGYVPAPLTILEGIEKLPPGTMLVADDTGVEVKRYWDVAHEVEDVESDEDWAKNIRETMERAVVSQMVSDVPLGAFLSGGLDSSAVVAFMARNSNQPVKTYSIGFDAGTGGNYYNELPYARRVSELFQTDHHEILVRPDVATLLPELIWQMDEPIADAAFITTYLVSKFAREEVTVILSGVGGDELFGGYRRYWSENLARMYRKVPKTIRRSVLQPVSRMIPSDRNSRVLDYFRLAKGFMAGAELPPDERYERYVRVFNADSLEKILDFAGNGSSETLHAAFEASCLSDPLSRLIEVDLRTQLPDDLLMLTDRMSMATSLECRVPLLDDQLVDLSMKMPSHLKVRGTSLKHGMKLALRGILPDDIINRKKRGFGAPIGGWFKRELADYLDLVLNEVTVRDRGIFDWAHLQQLKTSHRENREDYTDHLLAIVNFELWCQLYLDGETPESITENLAVAAA